MSMPTKAELPAVAPAPVKPALAEAPVVSAVASAHAVPFPCASTQVGAAEAGTATRARAVNIASVMAVATFIVVFSKVYGKEMRAAPCRKLLEGAATQESFRMELI